MSPDVGNTPLLDAPRLAAEIGVRRLWIKDESRGPTSSFKDRAAAIAASHAKALHRPGLVVASTGNAAAATCAHARRAGIPALVLLAHAVNPLMSEFVAAYGCEVVVTPTKGIRWALMRRCVEELELYPNSNFADPPVGNSPYAVDGYKAIGFEIFEQLGRRLPDHVYLPICYGDALWGLWHGLRELGEMGLARELPRLSGGEIQGSLEHALATGADTVEPVGEPRATAAFSIAGGPSTWQALTAVRDSGGQVSAIAEDALLDAQELLAEREGLFVETAAAAALAALIAHLAQGRVGSESEIVLVSSSSGLKSLGTGGEQGEPEPVEDFGHLQTRLGLAMESER